MSSGYYEDDDAEDYGDFGVYGAEKYDQVGNPGRTPRVNAGQDQLSSSEELAALRQEIADLKALVSEDRDPAVEVAKQEHRRAARDAAAHEAKAEAAATDPKTLSELEGITDKGELLRFMTERGYKGGSHL